MELPAIEGGVPVRDRLLPYGMQWISNEDVDAVVEVLKSDWITQGPKVEEFERKIADHCGARYAVALSSGTAALHAACVAAGISSGDEAITTPLTFAATANAITYCGGTPVFADINAETLNIEPNEIRKRISPRSSAILTVDFGGYPADYDEILDLSRKEGLPVIEDACHALGATYRGQRVGSIADMTVFSFHPVKHITTGEGGMVLTDRKDFSETIRTFRHHGIVKSNDETRPWHYEISSLGHNFRITDFQCALGISQLERLDWFVRRRREIAARYSNAFESVEALKIVGEQDGIESAYHLYIVQLDAGLLEVGRDRVFEALRAENIGVNVHYMPLHLHPWYQAKYGYRKGDYPEAERYYQRALSLPIFPRMTDGDVGDVIKAMLRVLSHYRK